MSTSDAAPKVHIGSVIRNAVVFDPKKWQDNTVNTGDLLQAVRGLFELLKERKVGYVLVGGIAVLQYVEGRNTEDIDLIMASSSLERLPEIEVTGRDVYFVRGKYLGLRIDILLSDNPLFEKIRQQFSVTQHFVEEDIPCATVEGLLLMKMYALPSLYRQGNFARVGIYENDIATLMHEYKPGMEPLFNELSQHLNAADLHAVREVVAEIQQRIDRFGKSFEPRS